VPRREKTVLKNMEFGQGHNGNGDRDYDSATKREQYVLIGAEKVKDWEKLHQGDLKGKIRARPEGVDK